MLDSKRFKFCVCFFLDISKHLHLYSHSMLRERMSLHAAIRLAKLAAVLTVYQYATSIAERRAALRGVDGLKHCTAFYKLFLTYRFHLSRRFDASRYFAGI